MIEQKWWHAPGLYRWALFLLLSTSVAWGLMGCFEDEPSPPTSSGPVDLFTSASPGFEEMVLTELHQGWQDPGCLACHDSMHAKNYTADQCASCHGPNGARQLPDDHSFDGCQTCHQDAHPNLNLSKPDACMSCHRPQVSADATTCHDEGSFDVIIIGAGGGGLAAGATLTRAGKNVLILEQHHRVGGAMVNFRRGDYRFEASLHAFDGLSLSVFDKLGIADQIEAVKAEYMYRSVFPDFTIDVPGDPEAYKKALKQQFPDDKASIDALFADLALMDIFTTQDLSVLEYLAQFNITDNKLVSVLSQLVGFIGAGPANINASLFIGMWNAFHGKDYGYYYFIGGSQAITDALERVIEDNGGTIRVNTRATKIDIENGKATRVRTHTGGCYTAPHIISNVNIPDTYLKLVGEEHLPALVVTEAKTRPLAPPVSIVYLGVDHDYTDLFPGGSHEIWLNASYYEGWFPGLPRCSPERMMAIANYSAVDPTAAPPGKNMICLTFLIDHDCDEAWRSNISYEEYRAYKAALADYYVQLTEEYLPGISEHIEVLEVASPQTVTKFTLNPKGAWAGWDLVVEDTPLSALDPQNHKTPIENLFLTGAWAAEGGQAIVLQSGQIAAELILNAPTE